jgi:hypothetical protein
MADMEARVKVVDSKNTLEVSYYERMALCIDTTIIHPLERGKPVFSFCSHTFLHSLYSYLHLFLDSSHGITLNLSNHRMQS